MKCASCVFIKGYKKADGMKPIYITKHLKEVYGNKWVGWCSHCGCIMTIEFPQDYDE